MSVVISVIFSLQISQISHSPDWLSYMGKVEGSFSDVFNPCI